MPKGKGKPARTKELLPNCGVVMPMSAIDGCAEQHWLDVREILNEAIRNAEFEPLLVSDADDAGIIQKRIIQNLYENPILICDVSGKNPNVMFELGLRLAFDKPTIIVKDDKTSYSFDTAPIEHLTYPRDLRFNRIMTFKRELTAKLVGTHRKASSDSSYTTFLKHFGKFTIAKLGTTEVSREQFILDELSELKRLVIGGSSRPLFVEKPSNVIHRLSDGDCEAQIERAIRVMAPTLQNRPEIWSHLPELAERCRKFGLLPPCFEIANRSCRERLGKAALAFRQRKKARTKAK